MLEIGAVGRDRGEQLLLRPRAFHVADPQGQFMITFSGTDGSASVSGGMHGFSGGYGSNDSTGFSYSIPLTPVPF